MNNEAETIKKRDLIWLIVLSGITFGIYGFYWTYKLAKDVNTICEGDENETSGLLKLIILSTITLGIYGIIWLYMLGDRLHDNAKRYDLEFKESGGTVVLWSIFGSLIFIGPFIATHIIIKNTNALASRYNKKNFANLMEQGSSNENQETHFESEKELSPQPQRQKLGRIEEKKKLPILAIVGIVLGLGVVIAIFIPSSKKSSKSVGETITETETPSKPNKYSEPAATNETPTESKPTTKSGTFTDSRDNEIYKTVKIGNQTWIAQNLNYNAQGSKCYGNDESNCLRYGKLYNWFAAIKACPSGWHLPSNKEWDALYRLVDGTSGTESPYKSETAGKYLKAKSGWNNFEGYSGNGTDDFGFAALPGGLGNSEGRFFSLGNYGNWWSSTELDGSRAYNHFKSYKHSNAGWESETKSKLFSIRCVMD